VGHEWGDAAVTPDADTDARVFLLVSDTGNRKVLAGWLEQHPSYAVVDSAESFENTTFDVAIVDKVAFQDRADILEEKKDAAAPVLLPYLLLLPESGSEIIESAAGQLADNVVTKTIDEIVSMPIQQAELEWRLGALLRLREQSLALRETNRELQRRTQAIDEAPVGITISDPDREDNPMIYVNDGFVEMTGYDREEALGQNCRFLQGEATDPDRVAELRAAIDAAEPVSVDIRNYRKDGSEFWNHLEVAPVRDDAGDVVNYVGFQQDVTDRKERQHQLQVLDRVLRHNLRNDMTVVQGEAELIEMKTEGEAAASARAISETSEQLLGLAEKERKITELLREPPTRHSVDIGDLLERVLQPVRSEHPEATISVSCPDDVAVAVISQFGDAMRELVVNAVVHDDSGSPEVTVSVTTTAESVRIEVADTGPRIPETERELLAGTTERTPVHHASGLGLRLVGLVVTRSGGTVRIEDNDPDGNRVRIDLPR
jgi:PAS domain S-box-containing protein